MSAVGRRSGVLAVLLIVVCSHVNAEEQDPDVLCLLQTNANLQRASVPSDFFEVEELGSSANSGARFDVGSNVVPAPQLKERLSLTEIATPDKLLITEHEAAQAAPPQKDSIATATQATELAAVTAASSAAATKVPAEPSIEERSEAVQANEVVVMEPPLASQEATAVEPRTNIAAEVQEAQLSSHTAVAKEKNENTHGLHEEDTAEAATSFFERQADAGAEDATDSSADDVEPSDVGANILAAFLQTRIRERSAAREVEPPRKLFKDFLKEAATQSLTDSDAGRVMDGAPMRMMPREPDSLLDLPHEESLSETRDLRDTMARVNADERRLLDALSARRKP